MAGHVTEDFGLVSCIDADANAPGTFWGDAVDMGSYHKIVYILSCGTMAASATADYAVWGATTSNGTYGAITGGSATQLTQAGSDSDKQVIIEMDAQTVLRAGYRYVKDRLLVGTDAVDSGTIGLAFFPRHGPATAGDLASVDEIVTA